MVNLTTSSPVGLSSGYDIPLVILSVLVAIFGSFAALQVAGRISENSGRLRLMWIASAAILMGGGIWCMHFIAMMAFSLPVPVNYNLGLTLASLAIAILFTGIGFTVTSRPGSGLSALIPGGMLMGLGIAAMHYTGMAAMEMKAALVYRWEYFALSIAIAVITSTVALKLFLVKRGIWARVAAAPLMGLAIAGMHYTGMAGTICVPAPESIVEPTDLIRQSTLAVMTAIGAVLIIGVGLFSEMADRLLQAEMSRREAKSHLDNERFNRALLENSSDLIFLTDRDGIIRFAIASDLGVDQGALVGEPLLQLIEPERRAEAAAMFEALIAGREQGRLDTRLAFPDGSTRDYELLARDLCDDDAVGGIVFTLHDVTQRKELTEETRRAKESADQANRAKSQFIANVSHELRTPLNAIIGFSDILASDRSSPVEEQVEYARYIRYSGEHLLEIINNVIDTSRLEFDEMTLQEERFDLVPFLTYCTELLPTEVREQHRRVDITPPSSPVSLLGDRRKLAKIVSCLLANALKFSAESERVAISVDLPDAGDIAIRIEDHGVGISAEQLETLGQPFVQADGSLTRRHQGTGLGLSVAMGLARLHGGRIDLASTEGEGTTAVLHLPAERVDKHHPADSLSA